MLEGLLDSMRWEMTFSEMGSFWDGFFVTLQVVIAGLALSLILGTLLGVFSTTRSRVLRAISRIYVEFYQNTPLPVQVFFMYMAGPQLLQAITGAASPVRISSFALGFLGVGLYHAAYVSDDAVGVKPDGVLKLHCAVLGLCVEHAAYGKLCAVCRKQRLRNCNVSAAHTLAYHAGRPVCFSLRLIVRGLLCVVYKLGLKLLSEAIPRVDVVHSGALILGADAACRFVCIFGRT